MSFVIYLADLLANLGKRKPDSLGFFSSFKHLMRLFLREGVYMVNTPSGFFHIRDNLVGLGFVGLKSTFRPPPRCSALLELAS